MDNLVSESASGAETCSKPPPPRIGRLDTLQRVRLEARQLYVSARRGEIPAADASRLASILALIATLLRDGALDDLAERVRAGGVHLIAVGEGDLAIYR